jgi:hypothetical protein
MEMTWVFSWHFGQRVPGISIFPSHSTQTLCQVYYDFVRSLTNFSSQWQHEHEVRLNTFMHNVQLESKPRPWSLKDKNDYAYGHCKFQNSSNKFRTFLSFLFFLNVLLEIYKIKTIIIIIIIVLLFQNY